MKDIPDSLALFASTTLMTLLPSSTTVVADTGEYLDCGTRSGSLWDTGGLFVVCGTYDLIDPDAHCVDGEPIPSDEWEAAARKVIAELQVHMNAMISMVTCGPCPSGWGGFREVDLIKPNGSVFDDPSSVVVVSSGVNCELDAIDLCLGYDGAFSAGCNDNPCEWQPEPF